jgi:hypothetical protein
MTLRDDGKLEAREKELLYLWGEFCQSWYAASFIAPDVELADEFAKWLMQHWTSEETVREMREKASADTRWRDPGLFSWERDLLELWKRYSLEVRETDFARLGEYRWVAADCPTAASLRFAQPSSAAIRSRLANRRVMTRLLARSGPIRPRSEPTPNGSVGAAPKRVASSRSSTLPWSGRASDRRSKPR